MTVATMEKVCTKCGESRPLSGFYRRQAAADGLASWCKVCMAGYHTKWREGNREAIAELNRKWREANPSYAHQYYETNKSEFAAYAREYYQANKEEMREGARQWRAARPDLVAAGRRRRRSRKAQAEGTHTAAEWQMVVEMYDGLCAYCLTSPSTTADHIIPLARGGSDWIWNIVPACRSCNSSKKDLLLWEWRGQQEGQIA